MRKSVLISLGLISWLCAQGCVFVHDTDCMDNSDCKSGRICDAGSCVDGTGSESGSSTPSGDGPSTPSSTTTLKPECPVSELGTSISANQSPALYKESANMTIAMSASGSLVTYIGGKACTLIAKPGFTSNAPCNDLYRCGGCDMLVSKLAQAPSSTTSGMTQWIMGLWSPDDGSCAAWDGTYYLKKSGSTGGGGGSNDACSRCSSACSGIPGCSCCAECGGFCFN